MTKSSHNLRSNFKFDLCRSNYLSIDATRDVDVRTILFLSVLIRKLLEENYFGLFYHFDIFWPPQARRLT